MTQLRNFCRIC